MNKVKEQSKRMTFIQLMVNAKKSAMHSVEQVYEGAKHGTETRL